MAKKKRKVAENIIALNKKARHDYFIEDSIEAGLELQGWEVKSLREGRIQLSESYIQFRKGEAFLTGALISPLVTASTHIEPQPTRSRRLLMHRQEVDRLIGAVERRGYTVVPLDLHWTRGRAKINIGQAKGKKQHDKRAAEKAKDWQREKQRLVRDH